MSHVGRPDDGTDVTSFFNLEFNVPLKPMEQWPQSAPAGRSTRDRKIEDELMREVPRLPRPQLQLLAAHPRQRRGGTLRGQGGQLGQALRRRPGDPGGGRPAGRRASCGRSRGSRTWASSTSSASPTSRSGSTAGPAPATGSTWPTSRPSSRSPSAAGPSPRWSRGRSSTTSSSACPQDLRDDPNVIARIPVDIPGGDGQAGRPHPAVAAGHDRPAQAGRLVYLPREQSPLHPDQVQRPGPRPGLGHRRGPTQGRATRRPVRRLPEGYRDRVVGRVRPDAGGQRPCSW